MVNYFLNENSQDTRYDTVSGTVPIWLEKVPILMSGVVYNSKFLNDFFFNSTSYCDSKNGCYNVCNRRPFLNVTCYLVDENGIIVLSSDNKTSIINKPLYKINPWLMLRLEIDGFYNLIIPGRNLQDCSRPPLKLNSAPYLKSFVSLILKTVFVFIYHLGQITFIFSNQVLFSILNIDLVKSSINEHRINMAKQKYENDWRIRNSHCSYFGVYHFNFTKWQVLRSGQLRLWCNSSTERNFILGYINFSNLLMVIVEDESELSKCGSMDDLIKQRDKISNKNVKRNESFSKTSFNSNYTINRYRKPVTKCYDFYPNESSILSCKNSFNNLMKSNLFSFLVFKYNYLFIVIYSFLIIYLNKIF